MSETVHDGLIFEGTKAPAAPDRSPGEVPALRAGEGAGGAREAARRRRPQGGGAHAAAAGASLVGEARPAPERRIRRWQLPDRVRGHPLHGPLRVCHP